MHVTVLMWTSPGRGEDSGLSLYHHDAVNALAMDRPNLKASLLSLLCHGTAANSSIE